MKIYQIVEDYNNSKHAGSKATNDAVEILSALGAERVPISITSREMGFFEKIKRQTRFFKDWQKAYQVIDSNSILILQHPFTVRQLGRYSVLTKLKKLKNVRIISLIHDVELLRYDKPRSKIEFEQMLEFADKLIVHNDRMKEWFIEQGVATDKLIVLEVFDYLSNKSSDFTMTFSKKVTIAGNLELEKSPYVYKLNEVKGVQFDLLGINYEPEHESENVNYQGAFPPEEVPNQLSSGFGLVWDGTAIETCAGMTGRYLRYNNPHKLSLYLSSMMPVIIWSEAAEAQFVEKYQVGLTVSSLHDLKERLEQVTEADYQQMVLHTKVIKEQLQSGYYLRKAVQTALELLGND